jgi:dimethylamine/trimethylamine dehydrogenase
MTPEDILGFGAEHVVLATGSHWRRDGIGSHGEVPVAIADGARVLTPDDIAAGAEPAGRVLVYDDDHYFMGGAIAERFRRAGREVVLVTPAALVSSWTQMTDEQAFVESRLRELGVEIVTGYALTTVKSDQAEVRGGGKVAHHAFDTLVLATGRLAEHTLQDALVDADWQGAGLRSVTVIGDALAPSSVADAVFSGHRYARLLDTIGPEVVGRERPLPR